MTSIWKQHESPPRLLKCPLGRCMPFSRIVLHWPLSSLSGCSVIVSHDLVSDLSGDEVDVLAKFGQQFLLPELLQFPRIKLTGFFVVLGGDRHSLVVEEL
jgi:hypothetical protein